MALHGSDKALMYAVGKLARGGATRGGYVSRLPQIGIGGDWTGSTAGRRVLVASLSVHDLRNETPNTVTFTVQGSRPAEGSDVVIAYGSRGAGTRMFGGTLLRVTDLYVGQNPTNPKNILYQCEGTDYTWGLTATLVSARYTNQSATAIARDLLATYGPAGYVGHITDGLPLIDEISFTMSPLMDCFTQIATRIGGYAKCDYFRRVWLFVDPPADGPASPTPLTGAHPSLEDIASTRDLTQMITRALVEGGGVNALGPVNPGETRLPVEDTAWYQPAGGWAVSGPQRFRYTGIVAAGAGTMASAVGGATGNTAPLTGVTITTAPGAGLTLGTYGYAYTWITAAGESLPAPLTTWNASAAGGPSTAPGAAVQNGTGLGVGRYRYAFAWGVPPAGSETALSPLVEVRTDATTLAPPGNGPALAVQTGAGLPDGTYRYAVTFLTGVGETTPSPVTSIATSTSSSSVTTASPNGGPTLALQAGPGLAPGRYYYSFTYQTAQGETTNLGNATAITVPARMADPTVAPTLQSVGNAGKLTPNGVYTVGYAWSADAAGLYLTKVSPLKTATAGNGGGLWGSAPTDGTGQQGWLIMSVAGQTALYRVRPNFSANLSDIATMTDAQIAACPSITVGAASTWAKGQILLSGISTSFDAHVTARRIYRTRLNGSTLQFLTTLADNTNTTLAAADTAPDTALGATMPTTNTAVIVTTTYKQQVLVTGIPIGPGGVTSRRIYRSTKNGSALALLTTLSNNVATALASPDTTPDASLGAAAPPTNTTTITAQQVTVSSIAAGPSGTTSRVLYRTAVNGTTFQLLTTLNNNSTTTFTDATPDSGLGRAAPATPTANLTQAVVAGITVGPAGVTSRKVYRTAVNGPQLKLLATLANNTATAIAADTLADASLGANVPTTDTSGLVSGSGGQVNPGAASLPVANVTPFAPEGWALAAGQLIRYKGVSATALTGIPAAGIGAVTLPIPYNAVIAVAPQLTGIPATGAGAIALAILAGDPVNLLVIVDNLDAQAWLKAALGGPPATGIIEGYEQDRRISVAEALSRAGARLDLKGVVLETIRYRCRDPLTQTGATVDVDLPAPFDIAGTFEIQDVTIGSFLGTNVNPIYTVVASSDRFTFEDLIRRRRGAS